MRFDRQASVALLLFASAILTASAQIAAPPVTQSSAPANSGGDSAPVRPRNVNPPPGKGATEDSRSVLVGLVVDTNGLPQDVHVVRGVSEGLDQKAVQAVKQYRFKPAMQGGKPVAVHLNIEVNFRILPPLQILHSAPLELSDAARQNHATGSIEVAFTVDTDGNPQKVHVVRGVGMGMDEKAVEAIEQYRFQPYVEDGQPVARATTLELKFNAK
jgi:TonB family protein